MNNIGKNDRAIYCIASGSKGNCYVIYNRANQCLIVEAGVPIKRVPAEHLRNAVGVLVSHEHGDHAKYITQYLKAGLPVYALPCVFDAWEVSPDLLPLCNNIRTSKQYSIGGERLAPFYVTAYGVEHSVPCVGFIILAGMKNSVQFCTDCASINWGYACDTLMIECNWDERNYDGKNPNTKYHMSRTGLLEYVGEFAELARRYYEGDEDCKPPLRQIILMHGSERYGCDAEAISTDVYNLFHNDQWELPMDVYVCRHDGGFVEW